MLKAKASSEITIFCDSHADKCSKKFGSEQTLRHSVLLLTLNHLAWHGDSHDTCSRPAHGDHRQWLGGAGHTHFKTQIREND